MDFWDQQVLMESDNDRKEKSMASSIIHSINRLQQRLINITSFASSRAKARIRYNRPSAEEIYNQLKTSRSSVGLFSVNEIPEKVSSEIETEMYRRMQDTIRSFSAYGYLIVQGSNGDYTIKANSEFYNKLAYSTHESSIDFFEEEAIRLNEGLIKYLKDKKQTKEIIKNNKQNIIKSISKALKDLEKYFSKLSIEVRPAETVYNGMLKNAKLDTQCGSISFTKSGVSKAEIFRQTSAFKQYCKQNKFNYRFKFIDSNTLGMYNTGDGDMIIFLILDNALIK